MAASLNGLAFERAADPTALPDEIFAEFSPRCTAAL